MQARRWKLISKIGIWFNYKLTSQYGRIAWWQPLEKLLPLYTLTPVKGSILKTKALATKLYPDSLDATTTRTWKLFGDVHFFNCVSSPTSLFHLDPSGLWPALIYHHEIHAWKLTQNRQRLKTILGLQHCLCHLSLGFPPNCHHNHHCALLHGLLVVEWLGVGLRMIEPQQALQLVLEKSYLGLKLLPVHCYHPHGLDYLL